MARYFFHVRDAGAFLRDEEGLELPDLAAVRWEVEQGARSFRHGDGETEGGVAPTFEVTDESGAVVLVYTAP